MRRSTSFQSIPDAKAAILGTGFLLLVLAIEVTTMPGARFDKATRQGEDLRAAQRLLAAAVASVVGKSEERAVSSLFTPGGTHDLRGEFAGTNELRGPSWYLKDR